jgi:D-sedoheptulose 7-phosphate isomerase
MIDKHQDCAATRLKDSAQEAAALFKSVAMDQALHARLEAVADRVVNVLKTGGTLFTCGNGGSASQATHVTGELVGPFFDRARQPLRAVPLGFDPSSLTAIANDFSYEIVFSRQLQALGKRGDMLWVFSTSGNSPNVLAAMETAKTIGITTVLFSNHEGGKARFVADHFLYTPESSIPRVQELHLLYSHILCEIIEWQCVSPKRFHSLASSPLKNPETNEGFPSP